MNELPVQENAQSVVSEETSDKTVPSGTLPGQVPDTSNEVGAFLSSSEAADLVGVDSRTIRRWFSSGKIRGKLDGHKLLVHSEDIQKMSGTASGTTDDFSPPDSGQDESMSGTEVIDIEVTPGKDQPAPQQANPEHERLMMIIESQAHQLKAAGDVIVYLRSQVDEKETQLKLLSDSQHKKGFWARLTSWLSGSQI